LRKLSRARRTGLGKGWLLVFLVLVSLGLVVGWKIFSHAAPSIQLRGQLKGIGQSTPVALTITDHQHRVKRVQVELRQGERTVPVMDMTLPTPPWWEFWSRAGQNKADFTVRLGRKEIPSLQEGRATLHIAATNDSWGRFFRGGRSELWLELPVRFVPPQVQVLSSPHYINQGGAELVVFRVSPGTTESGIQVGDYFFPSWPVKESPAETRLCLFAFPYNVDPKTPARLVARDDAGNQTMSNFTYRVFPKAFRMDAIQVTDDFMARVVPPILSQTPELQDQGNLLRNFLLINGRLRELNAQQLAAYARKTAPHFSWTQPFLQLSKSKVEASFADQRTYYYLGNLIDRQVHLGFDLASTAHTPVVAANDGTVIHTGFLGIYGNAILIDHGCGLQTLYGHLGSMDVRTGERVRRGQVIGRSGQTGLAGGDHLHFTVLLAGIPVNPTEWWDPHWIHDRIAAKLKAYE